MTESRKKNCDYLLYNYFFLFVKNNNVNWLFKKLFFAYGEKIGLEIRNKLQSEESRKHKWFWWQKPEHGILWVGTHKKL